MTGNVQRPFKLLNDSERAPKGRQHILYSFVAHMRHLLCVQPNERSSFKTESLMYGNIMETEREKIRVGSY